MALVTATLQSICVQSICVVMCSHVADEEPVAKREVDSFARSDRAQSSRGCYAGPLLGALGSVARAFGKRITPGAWDVDR